MTGDSEPSGPSLLAELEIRHSRAFSPTRRVALGLRLLPTEPAPGWGTVLLAAIVTLNLGRVDPDCRSEAFDLIDDLEAGRRIAQPRLRFRFQKDTVGLDFSRFSMLGDERRKWFDFDDRAPPEVNLLGALYATSDVAKSVRPQVFRTIRKATSWAAGIDDAFIAHVLGDDEASSRWRALPTDTRWALVVLGFGPNDRPDPTAILTRFRESIWVAHPDRGGDPLTAGTRMSELLQARRILSP